MTVREPGALAFVGLAVILMGWRLHNLEASRGRAKDKGCTT